MPVPNLWRRLAIGIVLCGPWCASIAQDSYVAAKPPGNATLARGERIARMQCSACHVVASDQEIPPLLRTPTPSFNEIANRPATTAKSLQTFIATTHWDMKTMPVAMPKQMLLPEQVVDVTRYILSMRKP